METDRQEHEPSNAPPSPWVKLRSAAFRTFIYRRMVREASPDATAGDVVTVLDRHGAIFGSAFYNPRSEITLRMLSFGTKPIDAGFWSETVGRAVSLRRELLQLDQRTSAYRVVHAEGDGLSGLVVDRYDDVLVCQVYGLGAARRLPELLPLLHEACGTRRHAVRADDRARAAEGLGELPADSPDLPRSVKVTEHGVRFKVRFDAGHKTGFFCDQRDNRRKLAEMTAGADVLDMCCNTGGFGLYAQVKGGAAEVTGVDLDEDAIDQARDNANLNSVRIKLVHADAFPYLRQMQTNNRSFDVVVLDPPKLVFGRADSDEGRRKYVDLNRLAMTAVKPGGLLVSCSCSGAVSSDEFVGLVTGAARGVGRRIQFVDRTGAAGDHPVRPESPEAEYLKVMWMRIT